LTRGFADIHQEALEHVLNGGQPYAAEGLYTLLENRLHGRVRKRPCEAGEAILAVTADGSVYPCDHFVGRSDYCMGQVQDPDFPGSDFEQVRQRLEESVLSARATCKACSVKALCGGECPAAIGADAQPGVVFCRFKQETLLDLQSRLNMLSPDGELPTPLIRLVEA
jgi:uncharacterized protein